MEQPLCPECQKPDPLSVSAATQIGLKQGVGVQVVRHWERLLENAQRLHESGEYAVAVVAAQTACEVIVERAMGVGLVALKIPQLERWVLPKRFSYSLANENTRKLYRTLTGDDNIGNERFWNAYLALVEIRNESVHSGSKVSETESVCGLEAACKLVEHVEQHNGLT